MQESPLSLQATPSSPGFEDRRISCFDAALSYAISEGLPVFPVQGKIPYKGTRGFKEATTDVAKIRAWWKQWPGANVAVPTGPRSGWLVLDIDGRHAGFESLCLLSAMARHRAVDFHREYVPLPATRTAKTGGGLHLVYAYPSFEVKNTVEVAGLAGIDLRGEGGYIVVSPSLHPSGVRYEWVVEGNPVPLPKLLCDAILLPKVRREEESRLYARLRSAAPEAEQVREASSLRSARSTPDYWLAKALEKAKPGTRHTYALFLACRLMADVGMPLAQAESYMRAYVRSVPGGEDDYPLEDALRCLRWAAEQV